MRLARTVPDDQTLTGGAARSQVTQGFSSVVMPAVEPARAEAPPSSGLVPLVLVLVAVILLQRFAVPAMGSQLGIGFVLALGVTAWGVLAGRFVVEPTRFILFCLMTAGLLVTLAFGNGGFSAFSLVMLGLLYLPFIVVAPLTTAGYRRLLWWFQTLALVVAASGVFQLALQLVGAGTWMFPFDRLLPAAFFIPDFNRVIELGSGLVKATGLWLLEPSLLSQLLAVSILVELRYFLRPWALALLGLGLLVSFSGTGLTLLAVFLPLVLIERGHGAWLAVLPLLALGVVWPLADTFPISFFLERLGEFSNPLSSGSMRFFGPWWAAADVFTGRPDLLLFGVGPGGMADTVWHFDYAVQDSSWLKLLVEYGLVGGLPFAVFYGYCLFAGAPDRLLAAALLFQVLFLGGFLLAFFVQFLVLALVGWPRLTDGAAPIGAPEAPGAHSLTAGPAAKPPLIQRLDQNLKKPPHAQHGAPCSTR